jgi:hypothetical protein
MVKPRVTNAARTSIAPLGLAFTMPSMAAINTPVAVAQDEQYVPGVWHYRSVPCVTTTARSVEPRLTSDSQKTFTASDFQQSGVFVEFNTTLGSDPANPNMRSAVTRYQNIPGNDIMTREHPGDKVQVCFISRPAPTAYCDPDEDGRGRVFRVYDYRQHAQFAGMNSEHDCGGA